MMKRIMNCDGRMVYINGKSDSKGEDVHNKSKIEIKDRKKWDQMGKGEK